MWKRSEYNLDNNSISVSNEDVFKYYNIKIADLTKESALLFAQNQALLKENQVLKNKGNKSNKA